ncbi:hypothetical protein ACN28I_15680 [Archangium gephyra]|uniref:hypothetical protein n=1 Tax=Archangium gephyra TaxID=48 RepID=UPI003B7BDBC3
MRKLLWVLFAAGMLSGCKKEEASAPAREETGVAAGEDSRASPADAVEAFDDSKPYALTQAKLDAYVGYQRQVLDAYAAMARELPGRQGPAHGRHAGRPGQAHGHERVHEGHREQGRVRGQGPPRRRPHRG